MTQENNNLIKCSKCEKEFGTQAIRYHIENNENKPICVFCAKKEGYIT
jgi:hypothetical protein